MKKLITACLALMLSWSLIPGPAYANHQGVKLFTKYACVGPSFVAQIVEIDEMAEWDAAFLLLADVGNCAEFPMPISFKPEVIVKEFMIHDRPVAIIGFRLRGMSDIVFWYTVGEGRIQRLKEGIAESKEGISF